MSAKKNTSRHCSGRDGPLAPVALAAAATLGGAIGVASALSLWDQLDVRALWGAGIALVLASGVLAATRKLGKAGLVALLASLGVLAGGLAAATAIGFGGSDG